MAWSISPLGVWNSPIFNDIIITYIIAFIALVTVQNFIPTHNSAVLQQWRERHTKVPAESPF